MSAHRPFFVVRNPATGQIRKVGFSSCEDGMQQVLLTNGSAESAMNHPEATFIEPPKAAKKKAKRKGAARKKGSSGRAKG